MSARLSIRQVAIQVLRAMNYITPNDTTIEDDTLRIVAEWADLNVGQLVGTNRQLWLFQTIPIPLVANETTYSLMPTNLSSPANMGLATNEEEAIRANSVGVDGIQFPVQAWTRRTDHEDEQTQPVDIMRHWEYDALTDATRTGQPPVAVYITRDVEPILRPYPIPDTDEWTIFLRVQTFAPDISIMGRERAHSLRQAWQRWLIFQTAADCGRGPIKTLPMDEIEDKQRQADIARTLLQGFENDDHWKPPRVAQNEF